MRCRVKKYWIWKFYLNKTGKRYKKYWEISHAELDFCFLLKNQRSGLVDPAFRLSAISRQELSELLRSESTGGSLLPSVHRGWGRLSFLLCPQHCFGSRWKTCPMCEFLPKVLRPAHFTWWPRGHWCMWPLSEPSLNDFTEIIQGWDGGRCDCSEQSESRSEAWQPVQEAVTTWDRTGRLLGEKRPCRNQEHAKLCSLSN